MAALALREVTRMMLAQTIVTGIAIYFGIGAVIATLFLWFGVSKLDDSAKGASAFFRPMVFLGCATLWPFIVLRWLSGRRINQATEAQE